MGKHKKEPCPYCGVGIVWRRSNCHIARCAKFGNVDKFVAVWNMRPEIQATKDRYKVDENTLSSYLSFLREKGFKVAKTNRLFVKKPVTKGVVVCGGCTIENHGDPCVFCTQTANGEDHLQRGRERELMRFADEP